jgi:hypothetical protein
MRYVLIFIFIFIASPLYAFEIYSMDTNEVLPGSKVIIRGKFDTEPLIFIDGNQINYEILSTNTIVVKIPDKIETSIYLMNFYEKESKKPSFSIPIKIKKTQPKVYSFEPSQIDFCDGERKIIVKGENLTDISSANINGYELTNLKTTSSNIEIYLPEDIFISHLSPFISLALYDSTKSLITHLNIPVNTKPEIKEITKKNIYFNYYEIEIKGKNFINGLRFFVNNNEITQRYSSLINEPYVFGQTYLPKTSSTTPLHDSFYIVSCNKIIYTRYPITTDEKTLTIHIESQLGQKSAPFNFTGP